MMTPKGHTVLGVTREERAALDAMQPTERRRGERRKRNASAMSNMVARSEGVAAPSRLGADRRQPQTEPRAIETHALTELTRARERIAIMEAALRDIAAFHDKGASADLEATGSYRSFDEPYSVQIARVALRSAQP